MGLTKAQNCELSFETTYRVSGSKVWCSAFRAAYPRRSKVPEWSEVGFEFQAVASTRRAHKRNGDWFEYT